MSAFRVLGTERQVLFGSHQEYKNVRQGASGWQDGLQVNVYDEHGNIRPSAGRSPDVRSHYWHSMRSILAVF